ncbi:MAG: hypothetical protein DI640_01445 [Sphingomonas taxi]|uniref:Uncharacterized protein n=1 Tax=Sphingomonas taxi TaxID=1549858 RepID=A0A2W4Z491_9SPHN|nr:MAG: hypothetical protein DI640_01445 [Sphingomonas taxi]
MIEFIQDYVTKALPPESFTDGQQVSDRSAESELYFVRLGVAGFVVDGKLVDQDYQPIVRTPGVVLTTTDRRFADTGRGGEVIGLDAPQRATSGPGNESLLSGRPESTTLGGVEFEQLRGDLAASRGEFEEFRAGSATEIERLKGLIEAGNDAFRDMNNSHVADKDDLRVKIEQITGERDQALADLKESRSQHEGLVLEYQATREQLDTGAARIVELEGLLAEATKPTGGDGSTAKPSKTK